MEERNLNFTLKVWRQRSTNATGTFETIEAKDIPNSASFLEMLDIVNEKIQHQGIEPVYFDSDCREGICGMCSLTINGQAHGPGHTTTCQVRMWSFEDGSEITIEPWRAVPFPVLRDLSTDRAAYDRIIQAGGYVSANTGSAVEANSIPISKDRVEYAMDAAACIGCGACAAACPNASAMLFVGAKVAHLARLPQGQPERHRRALAMVRQMDKEGFGNCTNHYECEVACPKAIDRDVIAQLNREYAIASVKEIVGIL
jgi:succinate dehydrogenase / fumarate reductase iron-sulfur subunit